MTWQNIDVFSINVQDFTQKIIDQYPPDQKKNISLTIDSGVVELKSDFVLLKEIITELLDNALEFGNPQQGVELHFKDDVRIRVTSYWSKIPKSFTKKMYYPFFSNKVTWRGSGPF